MADKELPDLDNAHERLAVDRFLTQICDRQLAFGVRQKQPKPVNDAVAATLELQAHLSLANAASRPGDLPVDAINHNPSILPDHATELPEQLVLWMEKL